MEIFILVFLIWCTVSSLLVIITRRFVFKKPVHLIVVFLLLTSLLLSLHGDEWGGFLLLVNLVMWWGIEWVKMKKIKRSLGELNKLILEIQKLRDCERVQVEFKTLIGSLEHLGTPTQPHRISVDDVEWYKQRFTSLLQKSK